MIDGCRVIGATVWELPRLMLDTATDAAVDAYQFGRNLPIEDADVLDLLAATEKAWKRLGSQYIAWSTDPGLSGTGYITRTSATAANLIDQSATTWTSATPGFSCMPTNRGSFESNNVPCVFGYYGQVYSGGTGAGSGVVTLHRDNSGTAIATVTSSDADGLGWHYTTCNLDASQGLEKFDVKIKGDGTRAIRVYAVSLFDYVA